MLNGTSATMAADRTAGKTPGGAAAWSVREIAFDAQDEHKIVMHHFDGDAGLPSVYIQAGIHGNEHPGMIVTLKLIDKLKHAVKRGARFGPITIVPFSNPFAFAQTQYGEIIGRFDIKTGDNFNRLFPDISQKILAACRQTEPARISKSLIRELVRAELGGPFNSNPCDEMKRVLFRTACQHDIVLDLHADNKSLIHFYAPEHSPQITALLADTLDSKLILTGTQIVNGALDDTLNHFWVSVTSSVDALANTLIPAAYTLELRGRYDINEQLTEQDSRALLNFLAQVGGVTGHNAATTVTGMLPVNGIDRGVASKLGYLKLHRQLGERVKQGDLIAEIRGFSGRSAGKLFARTDGLLFCRSYLGVVPVGQTLYKIAGETSLQADTAFGLEE